MSNPLRLLPTVMLSLVLVVLLSPAQPVQAQDYVTDVFNRVNALRAEYGLPPYRFDPQLAAAAQAHSDWGASVGYFSHEGAGGTRPTDRAVAAGYGAYGTVRVSENIYWGTMATPESAVAWWRNSSIHFAGMTSTTYQDLGVGVAYSGSGGYFTLVFGVHLSDIPPVSSSGGGSSSQPQEAVADVPEIPLVALSTAAPDGSIVHIVQEGQAIWNISAAYEIDVPALLAQNNLSDASFIHVGDRIVVRPANTPAPPTLTPRPIRPTPTPMPRSTGTPAAVAAAIARSQGASGDSAAAGLRLASDQRRTVKSVLFGMLAAGAAMIGVGVIALQRGRASLD